MSESGLSLPPYLLSQAVAINFTAGIFVGFYFVSVAYANRWLIFTDEGWQIRKKIHWHSLAATNITLMLLLFVLALTVNTSIAEADFVEQGNKVEDYKAAPWRGIVACALTGVILLLADTVLASPFIMHRLWVTYSRRMAVMWLPIFLWFGGIACVAMQIFLQVKNIENPNFGPYSWAKVHMQVGPGIVFLPFLASTIVLNAYCTGLLIWRIWKNVKRVGNSTSSRQLQILIRILMESGVLYLAITIAHFVAYFGHSSFALHMNGGLHTIVIGIAYDLIIIRVGQNRSEEDRNQNNERLTTFQVANVNQGTSLGSSNTELADETMEFRSHKF
ncbi:hypothetical protein AGABI1DRAFT_124647 [Agaricus bisporus var. burnettii JB137-S8]|uniref:Uncharacterized protein n=1 Tax=Agaricus bisporus var. burnettii (strain JB137-S8 / ATCC MYA-4627 / FGSC 10392) TaxID=597362 RepID=K5X8S2_AGABU|nr:uncharacterized protein AGABI1DRAFT_124647 [Agaricus bisporus var. burnettii JB137-S8]EKM84326.1 hypothetical protein AGABI1DRAFT_124647 [Agaricus bisporus var. burnettii JB137-S8]